MKKGNEIYVYSSSEYTINVYHTISKTWRKISIDRTEENNGYMHVNNKWCFVLSRRIYVIDLNTFKLYKGANIAEPVPANAKFAFYGDSLYAMGGESDNIFYDTVYEMNLSLQQSMLDIANVDILEVKSNSATVCWSENNSVPIASSYELMLNNTLYTSSVNEYVFKNLQIGTQYRIKIRALHGTIAGSWSREYTFTTAINPAELSISGFKVDSVAKNAVNLKWDTNIFADGYEIIYRDNAIKTTSNSVVISGLLSDVEYKFQIRAYTGETYGAFSNEITVKTEYDLDVLNVKNLVSTDIGLTSVNLQWEKVAKATSYEIEYGAELKSVSSNAAEIGELLSDTEYIFRVRAIDGTHKGNWSDTLTIRTEYDQSNLAINNLIYKVTQNTIQLSWDAARDGTYYEVMHQNNILKSDKNDILISNLTPDTTYTFTIRACNDIRKGNWSNEISINTAFDKNKLEIANFKVLTTAQNSVSLTWDSIDAAEYYQLAVDNFVLKHTDTYIQVANLQPGKEYTFKIRAYAKGVYGNWRSVTAVTGNTETGVNENYE